MGIQQSYAIATLSSNLKTDEHHYDHEKLAAVALSGIKARIPVHLFMRLKYANDSTSYRAALGQWETIVGAKAVSRRWPDTIDYKLVAKTSLEFWIADKCPVCVGRGHLPISGIDRVLSDDPCPACNGTAKRAIVCDRTIQQFVEDMIDLIDRLSTTAGANAARKLKDETFLW